MILSCERPQIRATLYHEREAERLEKQRQERELQKQKRKLMIQELIRIKEDLFKGIKITWS